MGLSMLDKLTNYLMPITKVAQRTAGRGNQMTFMHVKRRIYMCTQNQSTNFKFLIVSPVEFDDVRMYADSLKANKTVIVNLMGMDKDLKRMPSRIL